MAGRQRYRYYCLNALQHKWSLKHVLVLGVLCVVSTSFVYAGFSIDPIRRELRLRRGETTRESSWIRMPGDTESIAIKINRKDILEENNHIALTDWLTFDQTVFTFDVSPEFFDTQFQTQKDIKRLCKAIRKNFRVYRKLLKKYTTTALNEVLAQPDLYDQWVMEKGETVPLTATTHQLIRDTESLRKTAFIELNDNQKTGIRRLNRLIFQQMYPGLCPQAEFSKESKTVRVWYTIHVPTDVVGEIAATVSVCPHEKIGGMIEQVFTVPLYVFIEGTEQYNGVIRATDIDIQPPNVLCRVEIANKGNVHFRPEGTVTFYKGKTRVGVCRIDEGWPVFPQATRDIYGKGTFELEKGTYKMKVEMSYQQGSVFGIQEYTVAIDETGHVIRIQAL